MVVRAYSWVYTQASFQAVLSRGPYGVSGIEPQSNALTSALSLGLPASCFWFVSTELLPSQKCNIEPFFTGFWDDPTCLHLHNGLRPIRNFLVLF